MRRFVNVWGVLLCSKKNRREGEIVKHQERKDRVKEIKLELECLMPRKVAMSNRNAAFSKGFSLFDGRFPLSCLPPNPHSVTTR